MYLSSRVNLEEMELVTAVKHLLVVWRQPQIIRNCNDVLNTRSFAGRKFEGLQHFMGKGSWNICPSKWRFTLEIAIGT
jgi:hypothetical protein